MTPLKESYAGLTAFLGTALSYAAWESAPGCVVS